jgi:hypothetical protein
MGTAVSSKCLVLLEGATKKHSVREKSGLRNRFVQPNFTRLQDSTAQSGREGALDAKYPCVKRTGALSS